MDAIKLNEAVAGLLKDKAQRPALAELLTEYTQPNHIGVDFISLLLNTRALNPGDSLVKKMRKGIRVHTLVPGSIHLASEVTVSERMNYVLDGADVKVTASEWDLANGSIGTVADLRSEMAAKLRDYLQNKVFTALSSIWSLANTPDNYINVGGPITATVLENAINQITATTGGVRAVVGLRSLMNPITKFGAFWNDGAVSPTAWGNDAQINQVIQNGFLGKYYGANLVALQQEWDNLEDMNTLLPTDKILVIGNNVGEFITFGPAMSKEYTDSHPTPSQWVWEIWQQFGMIIDRAAGIYVIDGLT